MFKRNSVVLRLEQPSAAGGDPERGRVGLEDAERDDSPPHVRGTDRPPGEALDPFGGERGDGLALGGVGLLRGLGRLGFGGFRLGLLGIVLLGRVFLGAGLGGILARGRRGGHEDHGRHAEEDRRERRGDAV